MAAGELPERLNWRGLEPSVSTVSPELALVDPTLAALERANIAHRLDGWWTRTEQRPAPRATTSSVARRNALLAVLLASMLVNGVLTAFLLFGQRDRAPLQPASPPTQTATVADGAAQVINIPPSPPSQLRRTRSK